VDKECESKIVAMLRRDFPHHWILAEEETEIGGPERDYRWIVDPMDGTTNFAHGYPQLMKRPERTLTAFPSGDRKLATHQPDVHKKRQGKLIPILFAFRFCIFTFEFFISNMRP
jgi:Inositol monophosphatase family